MHIINAAADEPFIEKWWNHMGARSWIRVVSYVSLKADRKLMMDIRSQETNVWACICVCRRFPTMPYFLSHFRRSRMTKLRKRRCDRRALARIAGKPVGLLPAMKLGILRLCNNVHTLECGKFLTTKSLCFTDSVRFPICTHRRSPLLAAWIAPFCYFSSSGLRDDRISNLLLQCFKPSRLRIFSAFSDASVENSFRCCSSPVLCTLPVYA